MVLTRRMLTALLQQARHEWTPPPLMGCRTLSELSVGILGFGSVGQHIAERFLLMGSKVAAINLRGFPASFARPSAQLNQVTVWRARDKEELRRLLRSYDVLVLAAPLSAETRGLIGGAELAALPKGSLVVNVARGPLLDEQALVEYINNGHLGGAALDVAHEEPLKAASPLWDLPNVVITPHVSAMHSKVCPPITRENTG
jgi:phosphoglycerate dehydrogenase-like enzyme